jgi:hypothetical protein
MQACWEHDAARRPSFSAISTHLTQAMRTFATSRFKEAYDRLKAKAQPLSFHEMLGAVHNLVHEYARRHTSTPGVTAAVAADFFGRLQRNALGASAYGHTGAAAMHEVLHNIGQVAHMATTLVWQPPCLATTLILWQTPHIASITHALWLGPKRSQRSMIGSWYIYDVRLRRVGPLTFAYRWRCESTLRRRRCRRRRRLAPSFARY